MSGRGPMQVERLAAEIRDAVAEAGGPVYRDEVVRWVRRFGTSEQVGMASKLALRRGWIALGEPDGRRAVWTAPTNAHAEPEGEA